MVDHSKSDTARSPRSKPSQGPLLRLFLLLSSWRLSVALTVAGALYYVFLSIWGARSPAHVVQTIARMAPFTLFYGLLLVNTLFCIVQRWPALVRAMRRSPVHLPASPDWERTSARPPALKGTAVRVDQGYAWVYRRFATLGTLLLHGSLFVLALGFFLSYRTHTEGTFSVGYGQQLEIDTDGYSRLTPAGADAGRLPQVDLEAHDITTEFWEDELLFTRFTADVTVEGSRRTIAINDPAYLSPFTYVRLTSFGYSPVYMVIAEGTDSPLEEGAAPLNIFPPGTRDLLRLQNYPHRIYLELYPDYEETEAGPSSRSMRLDNPRVTVEVYRGKVFVARRTLRFGEALPVEGFTFSVLGVVPNADITVVHDAGLPFILIGFLVAIAGLLLRLPGQRQEVLALEQPDGSWRLLGKNIEELA